MICRKERICSRLCVYPPVVALCPDGTARAGDVEISHHDVSRGSGGDSEARQYVTTNAPRSTAAPAALDAAARGSGGGGSRSGTVTKQVAYDSEERGRALELEPRKKKNRSPLGIQYYAFPVSRDRCHSFGRCFLLLAGCACGASVLRMLTK